MNSENCGIYIHIPFCRTKCPYCDFYSVVRIHYTDDFTDALAKEIHLRKKAVPCRRPHTVYLGGGTPSVLSGRQLHRIVEALHREYDLSEVKEFTIEANPEDVSGEKVSFWKEWGINRVSLGTQSFHDGVLKFLGRRNTVSSNIKAIELLKNKGIENISVDFIYGVPEFRNEFIEDFVRIVGVYAIPHVSAYHLGIEPHTVFAHKLARGLLKEVSQEESEKQYFLITNLLRESGFEHYEISNYARNGKYAVHNSGYWRGMWYAGYGPSAHSYNGKKRCANIANLYKYLKAVKNGTPFYECENIDVVTAYNDYILVSFRTIWGVNLEKIKNMGHKFFRHFTTVLHSKYAGSGLITKTSVGYRLTDKGMFLSDGIIADFLVV